MTQGRAPSPSAAAAGGSRSAATTSEGLSERDLRIDRALGALYDEAEGESKSQRRAGSAARRRASRAGSATSASSFRPPVVQVIQRDAFERLGLKAMLLEPEFLATLEADVHLVADLIALRSAMPEKTKDTARQVVRKVVDELMKTARRKPPRRRSAARSTARQADPPAALLRHRLAAHHPRQSPALAAGAPNHRARAADRLRAGRPRRADLDEVILCVDQSGSMATSVVYSSIFAAVLASLPAIETKLVVLRYRDRRSHRRARRPGRGAVRRPARRRHRHQRGARLLRGLVDASRPRRISC